MKNEVGANMAAALASVRAVGPMAHFATEVYATT